MSDKTLTAVEWLEEQISFESFGRRWTLHRDDSDITDLIEQAKEMEKNNIDNKVIHFAEWLTNKHTLALTHLYEQFEEQYYNRNT